MAAQSPETFESKGSAQPNKDSQKNHLTINSSWKEIYTEIQRIQTELNQLKTEEVEAIG